MKAALLGLFLLTGCGSPIAPGPDVQAVAPLGTYGLAWTGTAKIFAGERVIEIGMSTRLQVLPLDHVRAESWLLSDGPAKMRAMIFEGDQALLEANGKQEPMPEQFRLHERQQFGTYEAIMLAQRLGPETVAAGKDRTRIPTPGGSGETELIFDKQGRLIELRNEVPHVEEKGVSVPQIFRFSGEIVDDGVRWPRHLEIFHDGKLYFSMDLATFDAQRK